jgi:hypothetical protein
LPRLGVSHKVPWHIELRRLRNAKVAQNNGTYCQHSPSYFCANCHTVQKEEPVRLILLMQREKILYMTDTIDVASFMADFYVLYKFASLEYVECTGILI